MQSPAMRRSLRPSSPSQKPWPSMLPWMPLICWRLLGCAVFTMGLWDHGCHLRSQWMWNSDVQKELKDRCKSPYNMRKYAKHRRWTRDLHRRSARNLLPCLPCRWDTMRRSRSCWFLCWFLCWWKITPAAWSAWSQDPKKKDYRWYGLDLTNGTVRNQVRFWKFLVLQMCFSRCGIAQKLCFSSLCFSDFSDWSVLLLLSEKLMCHIFPSAGIHFTVSFFQISNGVLEPMVSKLKSLKFATEALQWLSFRKKLAILWSLELVGLKCGDLL